MVACNACAESGKGKGQCCDSLYRHSLGRNDDDVINDNNGPYESCIGIRGKCTPGDADCMPGLTCVGNNVRNYYTGTLKGTCQLNTDDPNAHAASSLVTSSLTGNTTKSGHSFVLVVVGLLGAAMIAMKVVLQRQRRVFLRRHQYNTRVFKPIVTPSLRALKIA